MDSGGIQRRQLQNTDSIVKTPKASPKAKVSTQCQNDNDNAQQSKIPMQYYANNTTTIQDDSDEDDDVVTELEYIINMTQSRHLPKPRYHMYMTTSVSDLQEVTANIVSILQC